MRLARMVPSARAGAVWGMVVALGLLLGGCSYPARPAAMLPESYQAAERLEEAVTISVSGLRGVGVRRPGRVSNEAFREALGTALTKSGLFARIAMDQGAAYNLRVDFVTEEGPISGGTMKAHLVAEWALHDAATQEIVWRDIISSDSKAGLFESLNGGKRMRLANERAAQKNLIRGIAELSHVKLPDSVSR